MVGTFTHQLVPLAYKSSKGGCAHGDTGAMEGTLVVGRASSAPGECLSLPETLAAATPAQTAGVGAGLSRGLGWGLDVGRLPFSHLHSTHTAGLHHKHKEKEREKDGSRVKSRSHEVQLQVEVHEVQLE